MDTNYGFHENIDCSTRVPSLTNSSKEDKKAECCRTKSSALCFLVVYFMNVLLLVMEKMRKAGRLAYVLLVL